MMDGTVLTMLLIQLAFFIYSHGKVVQKVNDLQEHVNRIEKTLITHVRGVDA